ncbi:MAG: hypothetical protein ACR2PT_07985 [Endozoicomonas sp.]
MFDAFFHSSIQVFRRPAKKHINVTDEESAKAGLDKAEATYGEARTLVNCAGISSGQKTVSRGEPISLQGRLIRLLK